MKKFFVLAFVFSFVILSGGIASAQGTVSASPADTKAATDFVTQWVTDVSVADAKGALPGYGRAWKATSVAFQNTISFFPAEGKIIHVDRVVVFYDGKIGVEATYTGLWSTTLQTSGTFVISKLPSGGYLMEGLVPSN